MEIILASGSPRRIELMRILCDRFTVCPSNADETLPGDISPSRAVEVLARRKCAHIYSSHSGALVVGADTIVCADGRILGKPKDRADAARMLRLLSGRTHAVYTGVCLRCARGERLFHQTTDVTFYPLSEEEIEWYLDTGEPFDKAGAYGIQQKGALLVQGVRGDYFNVMGFPVAETARALRDLTGSDGLPDPGVRPGCKE